MRILITGGVGFIGSHLAEALAARHDQVLAVDNFATARRDTLAPPPPGVEVLECDIANQGAVDGAVDRFRPEFVIHCAASYKDPQNWRGDAETNVLGTIHVVRAAARHKVRRLIYFQTALCYGNRPKEQPITLAHPLNPESSYAISKTAGELYIALSGLEFLSFRLANVYGPRNLSGAIPTFYSRLAAGKKCFAVNARRECIFIQDLVAVVLKAVQGQGRKGYYHISSAKDYAIRDMYDAVAEALGIQQPVEERERGPDDAPTILLDPSKTEQDFGWKAVTSLREGIRKAVEWYKLHGVEQTFTHLKMKE